jgi:[acyl-carrier-protein] S-malonyltransferase
LKKTAFLFPGQGSQAVGMGQEFFNEYDFVKEIFELTDEITGIKISQLCFKGPMEDLTLTVNLQPAMMAVNLACLAVIEKEGIIPDVTAGHSLGEYSALCAAKVFSRKTTLSLVNKRGRLMHREALKHEGAMSAIIGLNIDNVQKIVNDVRAEGVVSVANHNTESQIVITGEPAPVKKASDLAVSNGAKAIPLKVSGAWHSSLMQGARDEFQDFLYSKNFNIPDIPTILNVTAGLTDNRDEIKTIMAKQLVSPVKWYDSMINLMNQGVEVFVEVGQGKVLTGLLKKILPREYPYKAYNVNNMKTLDQYLKDTV